MTNTSNNVDVAIYALALLGGATRKVSTEEIAYKAFSISPHRFSWAETRYSHIPDKEVTRIALEDAAKEKNGALTKGKAARELSKDGWLLTSRGLRWLEENKARIEEAISLKEAAIAMSAKEIQRLRTRIMREPAFTVYEKTRSVSAVTSFMFTDLLQCTPDALPELVRLKFDRLMNLAQLAQENYLIDFLKECDSKFHNLMIE
ncbi:MAG: hypothetical protein WEA61_04825 [Anaerolineales bacterium]